MLVETEPLRLAFNSAHLAPLLNLTKQNSLPARQPNPLVPTASITPMQHRGALAMAGSSLALQQLPSADLHGQPSGAAAQVSPFAPFAPPVYCV